MARIPTIRIRVPQERDNTHHATLSIDDWTIRCVVGAAGLVQASLKREGDRRTPIGVFPLRYGFYNSAALPNFGNGSTFPFVPLSAGMIWEEDGGAYNRLVYADGDERQDERLARIRDEPLFDIIVPIGFNDSTTEAGRGSALFIHAARADLRGTAGCIGVPANDLMELVRRLEPGMTIDIGYEGAEVVQAPDVTSPLETVTFAGLKPGPKLIVIGAVHGNEPCGPNAILRAIADCRAGRLSIQRGEVTFVPVANMKAFRQRTREGDRNLNRNLGDKPIPQDYEDVIGNRLCALLRAHDVLLDIHSFKSEGEPFVFAGPNDNSGAIEPFRFARPEGEFAVRLGTSVVIHGWLDVYDRFVKERLKRGYETASAEGIGTTEYMRFAGGYGVTLECGSHDDPQSIEVGYAAILNALAHLGLVDAPAPAVSAATAIQIVDVILCNTEGDRLEGAWNTGDTIAKGEIIVRRADGETVAAPSDGYIIFPNKTPKPGDGLCYLGVTSARVF